MGRWVVGMGIVMGTLAWTASGAADLVRPAPTNCPPGHEPRTEHGGPYCTPPPPTSCPPEHEPKTHRDRAYCEPPPAKPCPRGSYWTSKSATDAYCVGARLCRDPEYCQRQGGTCVESKLCVRQIRQRRHVQEIVSGECQSEGDCPDGEKCVLDKRCDSGREKRVASSPSAAVPVLAPTTDTAAPATATAAPAEGSPSPAGSGPGEVTPEATPRTPPSGNGCAGCATAARDEATGSAAIAALLGVLGLAWRRRRD